MFRRWSHRLSPILLFAWLLCVGGAWAQGDPIAMYRDDLPPSFGTSTQDHAVYARPAYTFDNPVGTGYNGNSYPDSSMNVVPVPDYYGVKPAPVVSGGCVERTLQVLPEGLIYRSYLAGPKEPRMGAYIAEIQGDTWVWGATVGGRIGLLRLGTSDPIHPSGFQLDAEGAAMVRLNIEDEMDVQATDYRGGVGVSWGNERLQTKLAYYHVSSHLGDEFLIKNPTFPVYSQSRDAIVLGLSYFLQESLRLYGETGFAFNSIASEPWEFQFGLDWAPYRPTGIHGAPFFAVNGYLRQEQDFGGGFNLHTGWAWRSDVNAHLFRIGLLYYNGKSTQYAFLPLHEEIIGAGMWYDF